MKQDTIEAVVGTVFLAALVLALAFLIAFANRSAERECRARGGQVIDRPGEINGCLRPAGGVQ